jgi:hypothetical protein
MTVFFLGTVAVGWLVVAVDWLLLFVLLFLIVLLE